MNSLNDTLPEIEKEDIDRLKEKIQNAEHYEFQNIEGEIEETNET